MIQRISSAQLIAFAIPSLDSAPYCIATRIRLRAVTFWFQSPCCIPSRTTADRRSTLLGSLCVTRSHHLCRNTHSTQSSRIFTDVVFHAHSDTVFAFSTFALCIAHSTGRIRRITRIIRSFGTHLTRIIYHQIDSSHQSLSGVDTY